LNKLIFQVYFSPLNFFSYFPQRETDTIPRRIYAYLLPFKKSWNRITQIRRTKN